MSLRQPVVVELVGDVADALPVAPADGRELGGAQRLGDERVVVDRHDVGPHRGAAAPGTRSWPARRGPRARAARAVRNRTPAPSAPDPRDRGVLGDAHAEAQARRPQPPGQPGRVDQRDPVAVPAAGEVRRRVDLGPDRVASRNTASWPNSRACSHVLAHPVDLVRLRSRPPARRCARSRSRCRRRATRLLDRVEVRRSRAAPAPASRPGSGPARWPARGSGSPRRTRRCARTPPSRPCGLEQHDVARRVGLLGEQRGPQPGVAAADHREVGLVSRRPAAAQAAGASGESSQNGSARRRPARPTPRRHAFFRPADTAADDRDQDAEQRRSACP